MPRAKFYWLLSNIDLDEDALQPRFSKRNKLPFVDSDSEEARYQVWFALFCVKGPWLVSVLMESILPSQSLTGDISFDSILESEIPMVGKLVSQALTTLTDISVTSLVLISAMVG